jgi:hypothetical protein
MTEKSIPTYADFVRKLFNRTGDLSKDFTHAVLGIATEVHEYLSAIDEVNALEELGDLAFYLEALRQVACDHCGHHVELFPIPYTNDLLDEASVRGAGPMTADMVNNLLDISKRWVGYGKEPKSVDGVFLDAARLIKFVHQTGPFQFDDAERIEKANMAKLLVRYPGGDFDAFRAITRDLEAERGVLQAS